MRSACCNGAQWHTTRCTSLFGQLGEPLLANHLTDNPAYAFNATHPSIAVFIDECLKAGNDPADTSVVPFPLIASSLLCLSFSFSPSGGVCAVACKAAVARCVNEGIWFSSRWILAFVVCSASAIFLYLRFYGYCRRNADEFASTPPTVYLLHFHLHGFCGITNAPSRAC